MKSYKLIGVAGKIRGQGFELSNGKTVFGRGEMCDHQIDINGVSSTHFQIKLNDGFLNIEDLKSSNGTFVNKKIIKIKNLKVGDVIAIPDCMFKVIEIETEYIDKPIQTNVDTNLSDKSKSVLKTKLMPILFKLNETYEWKVLLFFFIALTSFISSMYSIDSLIGVSEDYVEIEVAKKAQIIAHEVVRKSRSNLSAKRYDKINLNYLFSIPELKSYQLLDPSGIILAPSTMSQNYTDDSFVLTGIDLIKDGKQRTYTKILAGSHVGVIQSINAQNLDSNSSEIVGFIALKLESKTLSNLKRNEKRYYLEVLIITLILSILIGFIVYFLTIQHLDELKVESNKLIEGSSNKIKVKSLFSETKDLTQIISQLAFRVKELSREEGDDFEIEESDEPYLLSLQEILKGYPGAGLILKTDKSIHALNPDAEDILGIRESMVSGEDLSDVIRDQSVVAKIMTLCDESSSQNGDHCQGHVEISGADFLVSLTSLIGKDNFPKGYLISFYKEA